MLWFILQQCWQITAKPSSSLQSVWLSHCSTIDSVMLPCDPLPCSHCWSGEGLVSCAFGKLWDGHTLGVGGSSAMRQDTMGTWKTRGSDSGWWHELQKGFCYVRRDLDFSGLCCFEPITQDAKFISMEGQRQQANALWHTYSSLEMNSTLWWVWDLRWSLKPLLNAVFTRCQSREDCVPRDPLSLKCIATGWGTNWQCSGKSIRLRASPCRRELLCPHSPSDMNANRNEHKFE